MLEGRRVRALLTARRPRDRRATDDGRALGARAVILASGGAAALWSRTTNPPGSFGSGLLLARAAAPTLADLEFVQFHPTAVVGVKGREGFLITEAIRGEGATLHDADGERFVDELAPRDAVARAIFRLLRDRRAGRRTSTCATSTPRRFPNVVTALREAGLDPTTELVPVAPASHYVMGGDRHRPRRPRARVAGLYAVGEVACTGLHGANRLASNSLVGVLRVRPPRRARRARRAGRPPARLRPRPRAIAPAPSRATREAMWRARRAGARPRRASAPLLDDPHPLARLVAACALAPRGDPRRPRPRRVPRDGPGAGPSAQRDRAGGTTPSPVEWT